MDNNLVADPAQFSYNTFKKKYGGWKSSNFEDTIKKVTRPSELDELRIVIKYFLSKEEAIRLQDIISDRLNQLSDKLISFGDFMYAYKSPEAGFKEMRDRCVKLGNDWVCASYMTQVEYYINRQTHNNTRAQRVPVNEVLSLVEEGHQLIKIIEEKWKEIGDIEKNIPGYIELEIKDLFKGLLAKQIGIDRFWASMDIRSEVEGRPIITPAKKMELIELWVKHGIMLPAQKHIAKPEVTMPRVPIAPMEPVSMEEVKRVIKKEEDIEKRIEELRKKKELERQRQLEKERQEREKETGKPPAKPVQPLPAAPAVSPELDLMKDEIEKRIAEIMRKKKAGEGQAGEPTARYGTKKKELKAPAPRTTLLEVTGTESKYSGELKRLHSRVDTLSITEFDKELLKEEISQRIQRILEAEESAKPSGPEIPDEQEACPPHEAPPGFICPKCGKFVTEYEIWKLADFEKASITSLNIDELYDIMDAVHASTLDRSDKERLVFRMRERIQILKGGPDEGFAEGAAKYTSFMPYQSDELSVVETNLLNVGYTLRNDGRGHMVLPNGKGVSPTNHRGIVNHWEVIVDAGYLPSSNIFKLKHSPDAIVAGAINKGWKRWSGEASYEIRDLSKPNADFINMRLKQHFNNSGLYEAHIDVWSEGKYYNFDKKMWDKSNHDILQVIKKVSPKSYHPAKSMELKLTKQEAPPEREGRMSLENEYLIKDPTSIGDPDVWIQSKGASFRDEVIGAHHSQVDGTLFAYDLKTSTTIGYIDYSIFESELYINIIEVVPEHRRQGYATALVLKLKKLNPGMPVKWGMMTEEGCALKNDIKKGIAEPRHEYTKAERIAMAKAIASTIEKTTSESEGETCISIDNISKLSKEERIRLAKKIAGGETEVRSTVVRGDDALDVKEKCSEWDFGTFEVMLAGIETQDEFEGILDCLNASKRLSDSEIDMMRKIIEKKMEE